MRVVSDCDHHLSSRRSTIYFPNYIITTMLSLGRSFVNLQILKPCQAARRSLATHWPQEGFEFLIDPHQHQNKNSNDRKGTNHRKRSNGNRFVDRIRIRVEGGHGGKGSLSMQPLGRKHKLKPDGGHGGNGGSVILVASDQHQAHSQSLERLEHHLVGEKGSNGTSQQRHGRNGRNTIVQVPCGVVVKRVKREQPSSSSSSSDSIDDGGVEFFFVDSEEKLNELEKNFKADTETIEIIADLDKAGEHCVVARGGRGGLGSCRYASEHGPLPDAQVLIDTSAGQPGEIDFLELELKLIGDVGLVGFPNAGKSSTLRALSAAQPKVAPYPFTTLHPIMGCVEYRDGYTVRMADIPGLIDGASQGRGLGFDFLRHIERNKALLYVLDASNPDPKHDLRVLVKELDAYDSTLLSRRAMIVANKVDLIQPESLPELLDQIECVAGYLGIQFEHRVMGISAGATGDGLVELSAAIREMVELCNSEREDLPPTEAYRF
jgi:GTPase